MFIHNCYHPNWAFGRQCLHFRVHTMINARKILISLVLPKIKLFRNINKLNKHDMTWNYSKWWTKLIATIYWENWFLLRVGSPLLKKRFSCFWRNILVLWNTYFHMLVGFTNVVDCEASTRKFINPIIT